MKDRPQKIFEIYHSCSVLLFQTLEGVTEEQFNWKPAPDSRSIKEMCRHIVRVDNSFLSKLSVQLIVEDPLDKNPEEVLSIMKIQHKQFEDFIKPGIQLPHAEIILHAAQHYLYHTSQMIYLRRANDRNWDSPIDEWERITYKIGEFILAGQ